MGRERTPDPIRDWIGLNSEEDQWILELPRKKTTNRTGGDGSIYEPSVIRGISQTVLFTNRL